MTTALVRSRRTVVWGSGPLPDLLRTRLGIGHGVVGTADENAGSDTGVPEHVETTSSRSQGRDEALADLVVVLDPGVFAPVSPSKALERRAELLTTLGLFLDSFTELLSRVVIVTSAAVLGAHPNQPPHADDAPLADVVDGSVGDLVCAEREIIARLEGYSDWSPQISIVRSAALVGPGVDSMITRHFEAPRLLTVRDHASSWQFAHIEDVARAVGLVLTQDVAGAVTVGAEGSLLLPDVVAASGIREVELPAGTAFAIAERLHRAGVLPAPASDLAFTIYPWAVTSQRLRNLGWQPQFTNEQCLAVLLEQVRGKVGVAGRRVGGLDAAALGAAGAAVAVLGTAAIWRQVRKR